MASIAEELIQALDDYPSAKSGTFQSSAFPASFEKIGKAISLALPDPTRYLIRSKGGDPRQEGRWLQNPYIAVLRPEITKSPTHGVYVVVLMRMDCSGYYLSLNFGTRSIGVNKADLEEMKRRSSAAYKAIAMHSRFRSRQIDLRGQAEVRLTRYNKAYEMAHICGRFYDRDALKASFVSDLRKLCAVYDGISPSFSERIVDGALRLSDYNRRRELLEADEAVTYMAPPPFSDRDPSRKKTRLKSEQVMFNQDDWKMKRDVRDDAHESLLNRFSRWLGEPQNKHNQHCDLYVPPSAIVEAKTLSGDDEDQCRAALSQLLYLKYWYSEHTNSIVTPILVALLDRKPIGKYGDLVAFLRHFGIWTIWGTRTGFMPDLEFQANESPLSLKILAARNKNPAAP